MYAFDWWTGACIYEWELFYGKKLCKCNSEPRMNSLYYQLWYLANEIWLKLYFLFPQEWMIEKENVSSKLIDSVLNLPMKTLWYLVVFFFYPWRDQDIYDLEHEILLVSKCRRHLLIHLLIKIVIEWMTISCYLLVHFFIAL